jgi:hypothetical protein
LQVPAEQHLAPEKPCPPQRPQRDAQPACEAVVAEDAAGTQTVDMVVGLAAAGVVGTAAGVVGAAAGVVGAAAEEVGAAGAEETFSWAGVVLLLPAPPVQTAGPGMGKALRPL